MEQVNNESLEPGHIFSTVYKESITRVQLVKYAGASGDFNPLHTVEEVGEQAGTGVIAHGMLIMGMAAQGVTKWIPRKYVKKLSVRFRNMTFPGEKLQINGKVLEIKDDNTIIGDVIVSNVMGEVKVSGTFTAQFPKII